MIVLTEPYDPRRITPMRAIYWLAPYSGSFVLD
jgi:hypothetical protein